MNKKELATLLDVSPSAVSIAFNGRKGISDKTRSRILQAAELYGVEFRARKAAASNYISFVIFKKHGQVFGDTPFFSSVTEGVNTGITEAGYKMQMSYIYGDQNLEEKIEELCDPECIGIILLATEMDDKDIELCNHIEKPLVLLDSNYDGSVKDCVAINNTQGTFLATRYLIECGHTRLGYIHSNVHINNFKERYEGFCRALALSGLVEEDIHIHVGSTSETAYRDMNRYLDRAGRLPTALVADNDIIALSCMRALKEHGYILPDAVSIVGFDDIPAAFVSAPKLATVRVPKPRLGAEAVELLVRRIKSTEPIPAVCMRIGIDLVVRDSILKL
ncbi:LacI family transcriptional regulator [Parablautia intestinalis]|jgi:DNA-binding LacI/PurR family transcriptional regulator|uniref:LacI family transcriptional regulator n=1 Tax=Parablautia intestinalis TaxID=2320100 RepID=A0A3A9B0D7_9FIRM|nr:LacI family DNA-binding transcriptional regulator [Parablautia intestinalis]MCI8615870.1 LacI family transcriptional regulator [Lachnospiraceae bacterium]RKI93253.1 LacI family transcriptional regulator [Parablautia intestinalis]